ncbi:hypothetical protein, partial [Metallibacterium scheffleri]|uniref:hypothetical protein n=1 Tax=Metallibacterium scheffleri TaxID=993689 RepID=UPI0023F20579
MREEKRGVSQEEVEQHEPGCQTGQVPVSIGRRGFLRGAALGGLGLAASGVLAGVLEAAPSS